MSTYTTPVNNTLGIGPTITRSGTPIGGVTDASQLYLIANRISQALAMDVLRRESMLDRICNTNALAPLTAYGQSLTFQILNPIEISQYTINEEMTADQMEGTNFTITVDNAYYGYTTLDNVDEKQLGNIPLLSKISQMLADSHKENEYQVVISELITEIYGATAMTYLGQVPGTIFYSPTTPTQAVTTDRTDPEYIIRKFTSAQVAANKLGVPKQGRYAICPSEVLEIVKLSDQFTYNISGNSNKSVIEDGNGQIRVAGFDIYECDFVPVTTYDGQTDIAQCILGHKNGAAFCRQLMDTRIGFELEKQAGRGVRQLDVFAFGLSDSRLMGALPLKLA